MGRFVEREETYWIVTDPLKERGVSIIGNEKIAVKNGQMMFCLKAGDTDYRIEKNDEGNVVAVAIMCKKFSDEIGFIRPQAVKAIITFQLTGSMFGIFNVETYRNNKYIGTSCSAIREAGDGKRWYDGCNEICDMGLNKIFGGLVFKTDKKECNAAVIFDDDGDVVGVRIFI